MKKTIFFSLIFFLNSVIVLSQTDTVVYHLTISEKTVNFTGKNRTAMVVNNSIPGPTLTFTEGQYAVIYIKNDMNVETSVHWHGLLLPAFEDGVPYLNTPPIEPGTEFKFEFPIKQSGTYWYHSHTGLQEQRGVYGAIVIEPKKKTLKYDYSLTVVLSDWTNENPNNVLKTLKRGSEWYSIKKGNVTSLNRVLKEKGLGAQIKMWLKRMPGVDLSDVYFDAYFANGKKIQHYNKYKPGDRIRLRVINAATSTYFWLNAGGEPLLIVSADGNDVVPVETNKVLIAIAETYDFIITIPKNNSIEFRATAQDGTGQTSVLLGKGKPIEALNIQKPNLVDMMKKMAKMNMSDSSSMNMSENNNMMMDTAKIKKFSYDILRAKHSTVISPNLPVKKITLNLTGNMWRYIWSINGKTLSEADKIKIKKGEKVQITLINKTMMHHPMHLHGHFFRVLNKQGNFSPLKHTVDVPPMGKVVIEFDANEQNDWFFHCHNLYHLKAGMARIISYQGSTRDPRLKKYPLKKLLNSDNHWFTWGEATIASQMAGLDLTFSNTKNQVDFEAEYGWNKNMEITLYYERFVGSYFRIYGGIDAENTVENNQYSKEIVGRAGVRWMLPLFIDADLSIDNLLRPQLSFSYNLLLFPRLEFFGKWEWQNDFGLVDKLPNGKKWTQEQIWTAGLEGIISKNFSVMGSYDSRFGLGAGIFYRF